MPIHVLFRDKTKGDGAWEVEWDDIYVTATDPEGEIQMQYPASRVHRIIEMYDLDVEGKITFRTKTGPLTFAADKAAARDMLELVMEGLRGDPEFRATARRGAWIRVVLGIVAFVLFGGLFGAYCLWAVNTPDPPLGHWLNYAGKPIHYILMLLAGVSLAGPFVAWLSIKTLWRISKAERAAET